MSNRADLEQAIITAEQEVAASAAVLALLETLEEFIDDGASLAEVRTKVAQSRACNVINKAAAERIRTDVRAAYARHLAQTAE